MKNIEIYTETTKIIRIEIKKIKKQPPQPLLLMSENLYKTVSGRMPYIRHDLILDVLAFELGAEKVDSYRLEDMRKEFQMAHKNYEKQIEKIWENIDKK